MNRFLIHIIWCIGLMCCDSSLIYHDYEDLPEAFWHVDSVKQFSFTIEDTSIAYNLIATIRNASSYPFYNLYYKYYLTNSIDSILITEFKEVNLFNPKTGDPYGSGLGDLFDHFIPLQKGYKFNSLGIYSIQLQQFMRMDTLPYVLSVGARVEITNK